MSRSAFDLHVPDPTLEVLIVGRPDALTQVGPGPSRNFQCLSTGDLISLTSAEVIDLVRTGELRNRPEHEADFTRSKQLDDLKNRVFNAFRARLISELDHRDPKGQRSGALVAKAVATIVGESDSSTSHIEAARIYADLFSAIDAALARHAARPHRPTHAVSQRPVPQAHRPAYPGGSGHISWPAAHRPIPSPLYHAQTL